MRKFIAIFVITLLMSTGFWMSQSMAAEFETRCGWVDNPTPANWDLTDRHGRWSIGVQGGYQTKGDIPAFPDNSAYWVKTNIHYGYGCACLQVKVDKKQKRILEIKSGKAIPLSKCRNDKKIPTTGR